MQPEITKCPFAEVLNHAESIRNDGEHVINPEPLDAWWQGDIRITRLPSVPTDCVKVKNPQAQLAIGNTQGSRHCLRAMDGVTMYVLPDATVLDGPVIDATEGCAVDHPEHGNVILPPGVYAITYQRAYAQELRRTQD